MCRTTAACGTKLETVVLHVAKLRKCSCLLLCVKLVPMSVICQVEVTVEDMCKMNARAIRGHASRRRHYIAAAVCVHT
jgi:hypothetical protein